MSILTAADHMPHSITHKHKTRDRKKDPRCSHTHTHALVHAEPALKKYHRDRLAKAHNSQTDSVFQLWHPRQPEINGDRQTVTEGTGLRAFSSGPG